MSHRHTRNARSLRKNQTDAESLLWRHLRAYQLREFKFRRQHPLGPYIVDFVCMSARLVIELDGGQHFDNEEDRRRDAWLGAHGFRVLRFWNNEVQSNLDAVLACIDAAVCSTPSPLPSPPRGRGGKR